MSNELRAGTRVEIRSSELFFEIPAIHLVWEQADRWEAPGRPAVWISSAERRKRQVAIARHLMNRPGATGSGLLIPALLGLPVNDEGKVDPLFSMQELEELQAALESKEVRRILLAMDRLLGRGPGLTPSGDDLVAGLLLALYRWGNVLRPGLDLGAICADLLPLAYGRTTTLAANLIECASTGQADVRLINALDGFMAGAPDPGECAAWLLDYGSSSGGDAFLGMLLAGW